MHTHKHIMEDQAWFAATHKAGTASDPCLGRPRCASSRGNDPVYQACQLDDMACKPSVVLAEVQLSNYARQVWTRANHSAFVSTVRMAKAGQAGDSIGTFS